MKIKNVVFILMWTFVCVIYSKDIDVTIYCDQGYPPYSYAENDVPKGIDTDIVKTAVSRIKGYNVTIEPATWKRGLKMIETGKGFALFPPHRLEKERPWMDSYIKLWDEKLVVICREDIMSSPRKKWVDDYKGLTIGKNADFGFLLEEAASGVINVEEAPNNESNLMKLGSKRIDGYVNDEISIKWTLNKLKKEGKYDEGGRHAKLVIGATVEEKTAYLAFTNRDNGKYDFKADFVKQMGEAIKNMRKNGEIQKIIDSYIK